MNLLVFILTGLLLFVLFRLLYRMGMTLTRRKLLRPDLFSFLPVIQLASWLAFAFWGAYIIFGGHFYYDLIIVVMAILVIVGLAWYVFRDFLAGVLLKTEKSIEQGQYIKTPFVEGRVKKLGTLYMELINSAGESVKIPYSRMSNELFILPPEDEDMLPHQLELPVPVGLEPEEAKERVRDALLTMPWIISPQPIVQLSKDSGSRYRVHVTYFTHIRSQAVQVEEKLRKLLEGMLE